MLRFSILVFCAVAGFAQDPADLFNKPPADVDAALRARITEFFQDHVTQEYRKAEALVADDTKDFFYQANKPHYLSFEITRIEYSENFTRAKATVVCEQFVMVPGFLDKPLKIPTPSTWKLIDGQWFWWVDQEALRHTPFGVMKAAPADPSKPAPTSLPAASLPTASLPTAIPTTVDAFLNLVKADRLAVALKPGGSGEVKFSNSAPGTMNITVVTSLPGIEAKLDHGDLRQGGQAVLTLHAAKNAKSGRLDVRVDQTGETISIRISILK